MERKRLITVTALAAGLCAAVVGYILHRTDALPVPDEPVSRVEVLPTSEFLNARASIDYYRGQIRRHPDVVRNYVELAQVYLQQARVTADEARYLPAARDLLDEALRRDGDHYHALLLKASLLNTLHRFEEASAMAQELIARHDKQAFVYGVLVDALVELGEYERAVAACDSMLSIRPDLASYARAAYLRELHGDLDGAIAAMRLAAEAGLPGRENRSWALYQLGLLYLRQGDLGAAAYVFEGILEEQSGYPFAIGGLAHVKLAAQQYDQAVSLFQEAYEAAPGEAFLEGLAAAYEAMGDTAQRELTMRQIEQHYLRAEAAGENVRMEYADFLADHGRDLSRALVLARAEYERRPAHLHALETYAWALHKNGRSREALPYIERAMRLDTRDAMVHYRAAAVYDAVGQGEQARVHLERALEANLHVESPTAAAEAARALASQSVSGTPGRQAD